MKKIRLDCPAKINLLLNILNKRNDGFHNIHTIFEKISFFDRIQIEELSNKDTILITSNKRGLPRGKDNLCYKAATIFKTRFKIRTGLKIHIEKNIPQAAGLGGGSSNAAGIIKGLNLLWNIGLGRKELEDIAGRIGSDVPLFISKYSFILGQKRGEDLVDLKQLEDIKIWHILICPSLEISSKFAYNLYDRYFKGDFKKSFINFNNQPKLKLTMKDYDVNIIIHCLLKKDIFLLDCYSYNDFSYPIFKRFKQLSTLKQKIERIVDSFVHLSGSGSTLFTFHKERKEAEDLAKILEKKVNKCRFFVVSTYKNKEEV